MTMVRCDALALSASGKDLHGRVRKQEGGRRKEAGTKLFTPTYLLPPASGKAARRTYGTHTARVQRRPRPAKQVPCLPAAPPRFVRWSGPGSDARSGDFGAHRSPVGHRARESSYQSRNGALSRLISPESPDRRSSPSPSLHPGVLLAQPHWAAAGGAASGWVEFSIGVRLRPTVLYVPVRPESMNTAEAGQGRAGIRGSMPAPWER
ncbi:hypothetical protein BKA56DRAFT_365348 [Ilyonectria sp. MPI-CAGE-AT-0026]|nr:hypothetical protein BKA56DRAFT_365348 [Ilyonectria sp. MPI-CAGE-AT-0026]